MTPIFPLNSIFSRPNRVTRILISKYFHLSCVESFMADEGKLKSFGYLLLLGFFLLWDLFYPTFTEYQSAFTLSPKSLRQKPQQDPLSLQVMSKKYRRACSNGITLRTLRAQENKISTSQNMMSLDNVSQHPRCAPEFQRL